MSGKNMPSIILTAVFRKMCAGSIINTMKTKMSFSMRSKKHVKCASSSPRQSPMQWIWHMQKVPRLGCNNHAMENLKKTSSCLLTVLKK